MPLASSGGLWHNAGMPEDARNTRTRLQRLQREALTLTKRLPQPETVQETPASSRPHGPSRFHVEHYPNTRFFALYDGEELLAVTVYRKGAEAVRDRLDAYEARIAALTQGQQGDAQGSPEAPGAVGRLHAERARRGRHQR